MPDWPHAPLHRFHEVGTYIVTAGTYRKQPFFNAKAKLTMLCEALLQRTAENRLNLQAWAVFPNHYHFVAHLDPSASLARAIHQLHSLTARAVNEIDGADGRKVWFQFWDTRITNQRAYFARLHYVNENAVHHGVARRAANYPWCSAGWFESSATPAFRKTVLTCPCDRISIHDSFRVMPVDFSET